jgi:hypothetical protein
MQKVTIQAGAPGLGIHYLHVMSKHQSAREAQHRLGHHVIFQETSNVTDFVGMESLDVFSSKTRLSYAVFP